MPVEVPSYAVPYITRAAQGTGLSYAVVAAQVDEESGFRADAESPAGAEGPYQFLPSTFASYGTGSPFNWNDSTSAYINFMSFLLRLENESVFNALAAYNAGPGNIQAGFGYAQTVLDLAGQGVNVTPGTQTINPETGGPPGAASSSDDWSQKVRNSASQFHFAGANALSAGDSIRRL